MAARKKTTRPAARKTKTRAAAPKQYRGTSRVGIEEAIDDAIHKAPRGSFRSGDRITVVKTQATLRHSSPWHITTYMVTIQQP